MFLSRNILRNLNGSQSAVLNIKEDLVREIQESPYVKNAAFSIQLAGSPTNFEKGYDLVFANGVFRQFARAFALQNLYGYCLRTVVE